MSSGLGPFTGPDLPASLMRFNSRYLSPQALLPQIRATNFLANSYYVTGVSHGMDTSPANLAGRVQEFGDIAGSIDSQVLGTSDINEGLVGRLRLPTIIEGFWSMDGIHQTGPAAGDCFCGIELGSIGANTPFPAAPTSACIQVRFHRTTNDVVLYTARGDGVTNAASVRCNISNGLSNNFNFGIRFVLRHFPGVFADLTVSDPSNPAGPTVAVATQNNPALLPPVAWTYHFGFGLILCTGTGISGLQFSVSDVWIHTLRDGF